MSLMRVFSWPRFLNERANRVHGVNLLLVESDGTEVNAKALLEEHGNLDPINRLQPASCEKRRIVWDRVPISLLRQKALQQFQNRQFTFH